MKTKKIKKINTSFRMALIIVVLGIFVKGISSLQSARDEISSKKETFDQAAHQIEKQMSQYIKKKYQEIRFFSSRVELQSKSQESKQIFLDDVKNNFEEFDYLGLISKEGILYKVSGTRDAKNSSVKKMKWFQQITEKKYDLDLDHKLFGAVVSEAKDHFNTGKKGLFFASPVFGKNGAVLEYFSGYVSIETVLNTFVSNYPSLVEKWALSQNNDKNNSLFMSSVWKNKFQFSLQRKVTNITPLLAEGVLFIGISGILALLSMVFFTRKEVHTLPDPAYDKQSVELAKANLEKTEYAFDKIKNMGDEYDKLWQRNAVGTALIEEVSSVHSEYAQKKKVIERVFKRQSELDESVEIHLENQGVKWESIDKNSHSLEKEVDTLYEELKTVVGHVSKVKSDYDTLESSLLRLELISKNAKLSAERGRIEEFFNTLSVELFKAIKEMTVERDLVAENLTNLSEQLDEVQEEAARPVLDHCKSFRSKVKAHGEQQETCREKLKKSRNNYFLTLEKLDDNFQRMDELFSKIDQNNQNHVKSAGKDSYNGMAQEYLFLVNSLKVSLEEFINQSHETEQQPIQKLKIVEKKAS